MSATARRRVRQLAVAAATTVTLVGSVAGTASGIDLSPRTIYETTVQSPAVQVGGTYTPIVGNFAGSTASDIVWYAPGPGADHLWTSTGARGVFTKSTLRIEGTYTPLVGDFGGDGFDDIFWYETGPARDVLWTSVPGPAVFFSSSVTVNGTYRPIALDSTLDLALYLEPSAGTNPKDTIVWYRPGPGTDIVWSFNLDGTHDTGTIAIEGSPQLIAFNDGSDPRQDLLAYTPGPGPDAIYRSDTGAFSKVPKTVNGSYTPQALGGGYYDSILWIGAGAAVDAFWANLGCCGITSSATVPIGPTRVIPFGAASGDGYVYNPTGPDQGFIGGYLVASLGPDIGPGALPFVGDFDGNHLPDAFFYRPGAGVDTVAYSAEPTWPSP